MSEVASLQAVPSVSAARRPLAHAIVVALFFFSGAAGLVYEVLWTRQLSLIFGVTTHAVAIVLATFMGGLALGSVVLGRWSDRFERPLLAYAVLELGVGAYALAVPTLFASLRVPYLALLALGLPASIAVVGRIILAAAVLLPPTLLMGGTFPILMRYWVRTPGGVGAGTGLLYLINTAGALCGCLFAGFWALEYLGLRGTGVLAATVNVAIGLAAIVASRRSGPPSDRASPAAAAEPRIDDQPAAPVALILACAWLSGFTSLAYEVLWTRALLRYLYNSTYAFTTTLATFLAGIALGSALYVVALRHLRRRLLLLALLQLVVGVAFAVSGVLFVRLPEIADAVRGASTIASFGDSILRMFVLAALTLFIPTLFLGATFPLVTELCTRSLARLGHAVGRVYAVNTLGAILGSLGATFVLIPLWGMQGTLTALIAMNGLTATAIGLVSASSRPLRLATGGAIAAAAIAASSALPHDLFVRTFVHPNEQLVFYEEGATDTVGVVEMVGQRIIRYDDLRGTAGTLTVRFNYLLGHLPMLLHQGTPKRVLHICFGVGNSLAAVAAHEGLERVDNVELSPHVVAAADYFWTNDGVIRDPKVHTVIDDGRNFLMATDKTYDVILLEPPETFTAGVIGLYTTEFYREALAHLADDGVMMQWIPAGAGSLDEERMLFRAFADVFPHATAWRQLNSGCILLIGTKRPQTIDYRQLVAKMQAPGIARDMALSGIRDADHLLSFLLFDEAGFADFVRDAAPVTDDRTVLDFSIPRSVGSGFGLGSFTTNPVNDGRTPWNYAIERGRWYVDHQNSVLPMLRNLGDDTPDAVAARIAAATDIKLPGGLIPAAEWQR